MNASIRMSGESRMARIAGMMVTWLQKTEKLRMPSALARISVSAVEGAVVSKPMAKNITCRSGIGARQFQRIGRRVDDPDVGAASLVFERAAVRAGHAHHVAERGEDDVWPLRHGQAVVDAAHGQHADRAAGTVDQFDVGRQQILQAEAVDGVGVAAAHLHEAVVPAGVGQAADLLGGLGDQLGLAKLIDESHGKERSFGCGCSFEGGSASSVL